MALLAGKPKNLVMKHMVLLKFVFSFVIPDSPRYLSVAPKPTTFGVSLKLA